MRRLAMLGGLGLSGVAHAGDGVRVTLEITNVAGTQGQLMVALYDAAAGFPTDGAKATLRQLARPVAPVTTVTFEHVPPGTWAGFAVHDVNGNGVVDVRSVIPIPKEPVGATRDAKGWFGPPHFDDASFVVGAADVVQRFSLTQL